MKRIHYILLLLTLLFYNNLAFAQYQKVFNQNLDIYYRIYGEGQPILIIGGGPGDASNRYVSLCELLSENFKCILVEQRGTGKSAPAVFDSTTISLDLTIDDFEAIRKQLNLKEWNILGFSYGGYVASYYAYHFPKSVSSIIFLESMGLNTNMFGYFLDNIVSRLNADDMKKVEYWSDSARLAQDRDKAIFEMIKARMPGYFYDREKSLQVTETMLPSHFNLNLGQFLWKDIVKFNIEEKENIYNGRVLILHGRQDPVGEGVALSLKNYYKDSKLIFVEKAGHYSWIEQPDVIIKNINDFFKD